jgi:hypothetical protein
MKLTITTILLLISILSHSQGLYNNFKYKDVEVRNDSVISPLCSFYVDEWSIDEKEETSVEVYKNGKQQLIIYRKDSVIELIELRCVVAL